MRILLVLLVFPFLITAQQKLSLEEIWGKYAFLAKSPENFNVMKDGKNYADVVAGSDGVAELCKFELKTGKKLSVLINGNDLKYDGRLLDLNTYEFSPEEDKILLYEKMEHVYRRSPRADYYVYDIAGKKIIKLSEGGKQMFPKFSNDGTKVAFVKNNNLFIRDLVSNEEIAVTTDGEENRIKNGWADWVYEEEFSRADYFDWNVNGKYLSYIRFDETRVKEFTMDLYRGELYPARYTFKYPKAGEDNSIVSVHVFNVDTRSTVKADIGTETDIYIPRIQFSNSPGILFIQRLNRLQNKLEFLSADASSGTTKVIYTDVSKTYVDVSDDLTFVGTEGFIMSSERDDYNHLYYYKMDGSAVNQITKGNYDVTEFKGYDDKTKTVYYRSSENGALNRDMYSIKLDGSGKKRMSKKEGHTNFEFTRGFRYYISSYSNANTPPVHELYSIDGKLIKVLQDNSDLQNRMKLYQLSEKKFMTFRSPGGMDLNAWMMRPVNFDSSKKYPVYMYAYGGPGSNEVNNAWDGFDYFWHNLLCQEGYIVVCVDNRGTLGRGRAFKHATYLQLGKLETEDQIAAARQLQALPYVDKDRIGFQGWSYGGYMASLMITKGADVIKAAVAVAPVTNWKYYDNIYTERFLRKPQDNKSGYEDNSPVNFVKNIKGRFLLIHGAADDNVHMQNTMEMADAMVRNNIAFDFMLYPNKNHSIAGGLTRLHIYSKILKFVKENL